MILETLDQVLRRTNFLCAERSRASTATKEKGAGDVDKAETPRDPQLSLAAGGRGLDFVTAS